MLILLLHSVRVCPMQAEMALSAHTSPNQPLEHMIPSQLLDNEVFLGCKRRVASCSLSPVFKHPPNQQGREASATRKNARVLKAMPQGFTKPLTTGFIGDAISTTISARLSNARRLLVSSHTSPNQPHDCMALP